MGQKNAIQRTVISYPELRYFHTENECGDGENSWQHAHYVFGLFRHYLVNGANGYCYWNMVLPKGGKSTWGWKQNSMISVDMDKQQVIINPEYHVMHHFSHFIKPRAKHVPLTGHLSGNAVAFCNPEGSLVINLNNPYDEPRMLELKLDARRYRYQLPPYSITSVVTEPR